MANVGILLLFVVVRATSVCVQCPVSGVHQKYHLSVSFRIQLLHSVNRKGLTIAGYYPMSQNQWLIRAGLYCMASQQDSTQLDSSWCQIGSGERISLKRPLQDSPYTMMA
jgi:hypothetical protein